MIYFIIHIESMHCIPLPKSRVLSVSHSFVEEGSWCRHFNLFIKCPSSQIDKRTSYNKFQCKEWSTIYRGKTKTLLVANTPNSKSHSNVTKEKMDSCNNISFLVFLIQGTGKHAPVQGACTSATAAVTLLCAHIGLMHVILSRKCLNKVLAWKKKKKLINTVLEASYQQC